MKYIENIDNSKNIIKIIKINIIFKELYFSFGENDTIKDLKRDISEIMNCNIEDQSIIIGENYPYPLNNDLNLSDLLEEHRSLNLVISENPKKAVPTRLVKKRNIEYITNKEVPCFKVLNLQNIHHYDIENIGLWIDDMHYRVIEIDYNSIYFEFIMKEINDVLEESLEYGPCKIKNLVIYNKDNKDNSVKDNLIDDFIYKIKSYQCYKHTKLIIL